MSDILSELSGLAPAVLESLINATLVGVLFTLAVFVIMKRFRRLNAATRHGMWWIALAVVVALPVMGLFNGSADLPNAQWRSEQPAPAIERVNLRVPDAERYVVTEIPPVEAETRTVLDRPTVDRVVERDINRNIETERERSVERIVNRRSSPPATVTVVSVTNDTLSQNSSLIDDAKTMLAGAVDWAQGAISGLRWSPYRITVGNIAAIALAVALAIAGLMLLRLMWGYHRLLGMKRRSVALPADLEDRLVASLPTLRRSRRVTIRQAEGLSVPTVLGLVRPVILFPAALIDSLSDNDLENIALHEYAHVCRWDDWTNLIQRVIAAVFFFHPAVRIIGRQLCLEREIACDDWVIAQTGRTRAYATCLTKLVSLTPWSRQYAPAPSVLKTKSQFTRRIETLLNRRRNASPRTSRLAVFATAAVLAVLAVQMTRVPPVVAVFDPVESIVRGEAPVVSEMPPRYGHAPTTVSATAVDCAENESPCNVTLFGGGETHAAPQAVTVRPANAVTYTPAPDNCAWCGSDCCNWNSSVDSDSHTFTETNTTTDVTNYFTNYFDGLFGSNTNADTDIAYNIQYRHGETDEVTQRELLRLLSMGITGDYVREIRQAGLENVTIDDLVALKRTGVDGDYVRELTEAGLKYLTVEDVVRLRRNGVDGDDIEGYSLQSDDDLSVDDILRLRRKGISGDYAHAMRGLGLSSLSLHDIAKLRDHGVGPDYVEALRDASVELESINDVIALRDHGVSAEYAAAANAYSRVILDIDEIVSLRSHGISEEYLEDLSDVGVDNLAVPDLVALRSNGVDPELIAAIQAYSADLVSLDAIIALRANGVDEDYLEELDEVGLGSDKLSVRDVVGLRTNGVDPEFAGTVLSRWGSSMTVGDLITLRANGVTLDYLEDLDAVDLSSLSPRDVVALRSNGVDADLIAAIQAYGFDRSVGIGEIIALRANGVSEDYLEEFGKLDRQFSVEDMIAFRSNGVDADFVEELDELDFDDLSARDIIEMRVLGLSPRVLDEFRQDRDRSY
ncbi:MAG: hypothetical protein GF341_00980 [candidate division Zixibacteria bacterium]|nr:hypothetical protein [candidate division Zixibacteria bacterium]